MDQNKSILTQGRNNQAQTGIIIFWKQDVKTFLKISIYIARKGERKTSKVEGLDYSSNGCYKYCTTLIVYGQKVILYTALW